MKKILFLPTFCSFLWISCSKEEGIDPPPPAPPVPAAVAIITTPTHDTVWHEGASTITYTVSNADTVMIEGKMAPNSGVITLTHLRADTALTITGIGKGKAVTVTVTIKVMSAMFTLFANSGPWKLISQKDSLDTGWYEIGVKDCVSDDYSTYYWSGWFILRHGSKHCDEGEIDAPAAFTFVWTDTKHTLTTGGQEGEIRELSATRLVVCKVVPNLIYGQPPGKVLFTYVHM